MIESPSSSPIPPLPSPLLPPPDDDAHVGEGEEEERSWCVGNPGTVLDELAARGGPAYGFVHRRLDHPEGRGREGTGEEEEDL